MFTEIPIEKILTAAMRYGGDYADVFIERTRSTSIICDNHCVDKAATFFNSGIGIRVISGHMTSYGSTNELSKKSVLNLAREVGKASNTKKRKSSVITLREQNAPTITTVKRHPFGIPMDDKCSIVLAANEAAWKTGKEIRQVRISYGDRVRRIQIANSRGLWASDEQTGIVLRIQAVASNGENLRTGHEQVGGTLGFELFEKTLPEEIAEKAAIRAIKMLTARSTPRGAMPVILAAESGGTMIHEAVGHGLEADLAGEKLSIYAGRIGDEVANPLITVIDDSTIAGNRGSFSFDDEGTPAQKTVLIEKGILKRYLSDNRCEQLYSNNSTGNGRRQSFEQIPIVRMTNTFIAPGSHDPEAILTETDRGLYVRRMGGGQVNTINGDFCFDVQEGYLIENGKLGELVRGATLIGNGPKVLTMIDRVGSDLGFSIGTCGKGGQDAPVSCGQPTLRIPNIVVGGTA